MTSDDGEAITTTGGGPMRRRDVSRRTLWLDAGLYLLFAVFAGTTALWSEFFGYRLWGACAVAAYLYGVGQALVSLWRRPVTSTPVLSRRTPVALVVACGMLVPLPVLLVQRLRGIQWSEQPEVRVVERSATLLLRHGTPYTNLAALGRPPVVDDYTPYGPAMTVFGLPRALFGASALTDARIAFGVFSLAVVAVALRLLGRPRVPTRALQLAVACPLTALTWSVAGDDLPIVALIMLALALLQRRHPALCGAVLAVAVSMKLTASPALVVLAVAVCAGLGVRALFRFLAAAIALAAALTVPVLLVDPGSFVEHVLRFPVGLGRARSPADSPLPGNLIARLGPEGHLVSLGLLLAAGVAMAVWLLCHPPRTAADAALRVAVGLGGAILLAPATRYGYLVYPIALLGAALALRAAAAPEPAEPTPVEVPEPAN